MPVLLVRRPVLRPLHDPGGITCVLDLAAIPLLREAFAVGGGDNYRRVAEVEDLREENLLTGEAGARVPNLQHHPPGGVDLSGSQAVEVGTRDFGLQRKVRRFDAGRLKKPR